MMKTMLMPKDSRFEHRRQRLVDDLKTLFQDERIAAYYERKAAEEAKKSEFYFYLTSISKFYNNNPITDQYYY